MHLRGYRNIKCYEEIKKKKLNDGRWTDEGSRFNSRLSDNFFIFSSISFKINH